MDRTRSYEEYAAGRKARRAAVEPVLAFYCPDGYRRERPRDPEKAAVLREVGVPEELIGPVEGYDAWMEELGARRAEACARASGEGEPN